jgi:release factor glutamine methyltransferase
VSAAQFSPGESRASALARLAERLAEAQIEEPQREARLLLCAALDVPMAGLLAAPETPLGAGAQRLGAWAQRRLAREPLSRIRGVRAFRAWQFETSPAVLDPRPETELLVDAVQEFLRESARAAPRILDLGTGSGVLIISLLAERPDATGVAVDISPDAIEIAARNAEALKVADRLGLLEGDLFGPVSGAFDAIVSNPPYIPSHDLAGLEPEVRQFDPVLALDGGADGLDFYRRIAAEAPRYLAPGGVLALELGIHQAQDVRALVADAGFSDLTLHRDFSGIERHLTARWM